MSNAKKKASPSSVTAETEMKLFISSMQTSANEARVMAIFRAKSIIGELTRVVDSLEAGQLPHLRNLDPTELARCVATCGLAERTVHDMADLLGGASAIEIAKRMKRDTETL